MKIESQATVDLARLGELIGDMPVAMLASAGGGAGHRVLTDLSPSPLPGAATCR
ncbi:MAG: hypothetical protein ABI699_05925 [Caldimonas sp.]